MPDTWKAQGSERLVVGERYRLAIVTRAPYNALVRETLRVEFRIKALRNHYHIERFEFIPPMWTAHSNELAPWTAIMEFTLLPEPEILQGGLDPRAMIVLAGLIITVALSFTLIETRLERLVTSSAGAVGGVVKEVLNPGFVVLAFGAFALFLFTRRAA